MPPLAKAKSKRTKKMYACGTPDNDCTTTKIGASSGLKKSICAHGSPQKAFACHARHLLRQGFKQLGQREFEDPKTGYIRVLTKKSRFGSRLRGGKEGRHMPSTEATGGVVMSL